MSDQQLTMDIYTRLDRAQRAELDVWVTEQTVELERCSGFVIINATTVSFTIDAWPERGSKVIKVDPVTRPCPWPFPELEPAA